MGDLYYLYEDVGLAIVCYRRALELGEDTEHIHYALGESYLKAGENTLSLKHFERVLRDNPDRIDVYFAMTEVYRRIGDFEQAQNVLQEAITISPAAGADVYFYLAYLYLQDQNTDLAIRTLEDGLSLDPDNVDVRRHLADLFIQQESPYMAVFTLEQGLELKKNAYLALDLAQIYFNLNRLEEALQYYEQAWKQGAFSGRIGMENVGHSFYNQGDKERAQEVYARIR
jgi:tetratricopeptide (TPR) repeat protein